MFDWERADFARENNQPGIPRFVRSTAAGSHDLVPMREVDDTRSAGVIHLGNLCIDFDRYGVTVDGNHVPLTLEEFDLLVILALRVGTTVLFADLTCWLGEVAGNSNDVRLRRVMRSMRARLSAMHPYDLQLVLGRGYTLFDKAASGYESRVQRYGDSMSSDVFAALEP